MPNIIRPRNFEKEDNLNDNLILPIDNSSYGSVGKSIKLYQIKNYTLSSIKNVSSSGISGTSGIDGVIGIDGKDGTSGLYSSSGLTHKVKILDYCNECNSSVVGLFRYRNIQNFSNIEMCMQIGSNIYSWVNCIPTTTTTTTIPPTTTTTTIPPTTTTTTIPPTTTTTTTIPPTTTTTTTHSLISNLISINSSSTSPHDNGYGVMISEKTYWATSQFPVNSTLNINITGAYLIAPNYSGAENVPTDINDNVTISLNSSTSSTFTITSVVTIFGAGINSVSPLYDSVYNYIHDTTPITTTTTTPPTTTTTTTIIVMSSYQLNNPTSGYIGVNYKDINSITKTDSIAASSFIMVCSSVWPTPEVPGNGLIVTATGNACASTTTTTTQPTTTTTSTTIIVMSSYQLNNPTSGYIGVDYKDINYTSKSDSIAASSFIMVCSSVWPTPTVPGNGLIVTATGNACASITTTTTITPITTTTTTITPTVTTTTTHSLISNLISINSSSTSPHDNGYGVMISERTYWVTSQFPVHSVLNINIRGAYSLAPNYSGAENVTTDINDNVTILVNSSTSSTFTISSVVTIIGAGINSLSPLYDADYNYIP